jgi:hypothetical protein
MHLVYRGPGAALGLILRYAAFFITFLDVLRLPLLLLRVTLLVSSWHPITSTGSSGFHGRNGDASDDSSAASRLRAWRRWVELVATHQHEPQAAKG